MAVALSSLHRNNAHYDVNLLSRDKSFLQPKRYEDGTNNPIAIINVSGKRFETYMSTLQRFPNSLLGDPNKRIHFYNKKTGEYFFDRCRKAFNGILSFYQSDGLLEKPAGVSETIFTQELIFFELSDNVQGFPSKSSGVDNESETLEIPNNPYMAKVWILFEKPNSSHLSKVLAILSVLIILVSIVSFCVETIPSMDPDTKEGRHMKKTWAILNTVCNAWFTLEYLLRLLCAPNKTIFVRSPSNIIDLLSILPYYLNLVLGASGHDSKIAVLRVIRVVRVIRIFKLTRHSRGLHVLASTVRASSHELAMLMLFLAIGVILFSSAVYFAESHRQESGFKSIPHGFWWAVVTMTTVGYGDLYPTTLTGKIIGSLCAVSGVLVIALPVPVIVSNFEHFYKEEQRRQARENEIIKKNKQEQSFPTLRGSMKMMTEASIILAGGKPKGDRERRRTFRDKFRTRISFSLQQPLSADFNGNNCEHEELNGHRTSNPSIETSKTVRYHSTIKETYHEQNTCTGESKI